MKAKSNMKFVLQLVFCILLQVLIVVFLMVDDGILSIPFVNGEEEHNNWNDDKNINNPISWLVIILLTSGEIIIYKICKENRREIECYEEYSSNWDYVDIEDRTEEIFYKIQEAWTKRNIDIAKDYMSDNIYNLYSSEIQCMRDKHSINVVKKIRLITTRPVGIIKCNYNKDYMWFYIEASMISYKISDITGEIVEGDTSRKKIMEYWKVVQGRDEWVLDERLQKKDVDESKFLRMIED